MTSALPAERAARMIQIVSDIAEPLAPGLGTLDDVRAYFAEQGAEPFPDPSLPIVMDPGAAWRQRAAE